MATHRQPLPLRATGPGGGAPPRKPYTWHGDDGRAAQIGAQLRALRAELAGRHDDSFATPAEVFRERQIEDADAETHRARLATSREARATVKTPTVIKLRVLRDPVTVSGRRRAWYVTPAALAARLAAAKQPVITPPRSAPRCRSCGYIRTRCACPGRRR